MHYFGFDADQLPFALNLPNVRELHFDVAQQKFYQNVF
jgi:hypothetical protein